MSQNKVIKNYASPLESEKECSISSTTFSSYLKMLKGNRKHKDIAEILGLNSTSYNAILNGKKDKYISPTVTANLCKIFGIEPDELESFGFILNGYVIQDIKKRNFGFDYAARKEDIFRSLNPYLEIEETQENPPVAFSLEEKCSIRKQIDMKELRNYNFTLEDIASLYGISRERVRQIVSKTSLTSYSNSDLSFDKQIYFNGELYNNKQDVFEKYFPNLDMDFVESNVNQFIVKTDESFNVATNYYYFKFNQKENDYSRVFYRERMYRGINEFCEDIFPDDNPEKIKEYLKDIIETLDYDFVSAVDYLVLSIDQFRSSRKVVINGIEYETKTEAIRHLFPNYDENKVRDCINQRMSRMSFEDAVKYTLENPPKEREPFIYKGKVFSSKIDAIAYLFPDRDPQNAYYSINSYMNEHECSFEDAVVAINKYGYRNKRIAVSYNGNNYNSLRELCRDYNINVQTLSDYMNKNHVSVKTAMNQILQSKGISMLKSEELNSSTTNNANNRETYDKKIWNPLTEEEEIARGWVPHQKTETTSHNTYRITENNNKKPEVIDDRIQLKYKGKKYTSLKDLCNDYGIDAADVMRWKKKFRGDLKRAVEYCAKFYSLDAIEE